MSAKKNTESYPKDMETYKQKINAASGYTKFQIFKESSVLTSQLY